MSQKLSGAKGRKRRLKLQKAHEKVVEKMPKLSKFFNQAEHPQNRQAEGIERKHDK